MRPIYEQLEQPECAKMKGVLDAIMVRIHQYRAIDGYPSPEASALFELHGTLKRMRQYRHNDAYPAFLTELAKPYRDTDLKRHGYYTTRKHNLLQSFAVEMGWIHDTR